MKKAQEKLAPNVVCCQNVWNVQNTVEPLYFEVPREMEKKFEIAGFQNNRGSVKFVTMNNFLIKYSTV